jgi:hypothetical protein
MQICLIEMSTRLRNRGHLPGSREKSEIVGILEASLEICRSERGTGHASDYPILLASTYLVEE